MKTKAAKIIWRGKGFDKKYRLILDHNHWYHLQCKRQNADWFDMLESRDDYAFVGLEEALGNKRL